MSAPSWELSGSVVHVFTDEPTGRWGLGGTPADLPTDGEPFDLADAFADPLADVQKARAPP